MKETARISMAEGRSALTALRQYVQSASFESRNEAQTRFDIIDRLIRECFGWGGPSSRIRVEVYERGDYSDYELGNPRSLVWEAKRESTSFDLPPGTAKRAIQDLDSLWQHCTEAEAAAEQVQQYCVSRGMELAVVTNGHQLFCFLATRNDGIAPLAGNCFVVDSLDMLDANFAVAWDLLSPDGVEEHRYLRYLKDNRPSSVPPKLSSFLQQYPRQRYLSDLQANLRTLSELLIQDIGESDSEEATFIRRCYCSSGSLSQHALLNRKILEARYSALTESVNLNALVEPIAPKGVDGPISSNVLQEALSRRPVILIGDVGVGKTSFLKHLIYEGAKDVFSSALYAYINLGARGTLNPDIRDVILKEAERQLLERHGIDIRELKFLKGVYASEISRFKSGVFRDLYDSNPVRAQELEAEHIAGLVAQTAEHLRRSITHLVRGRHHQVVLMLDNADQRSDEVQQHAFLIAQELAKDWDCQVFVTLRPATFYRSRTSGVLAAYPHRVFTISPPRFDEFLEKRLLYALDMAEGRLPVERLSNIGLNLDTIAVIIRTLLESLRKNDDIQELLANVSGGNVREVLQFLTSFIGSPNVNADKIVEAARSGGYRIPLHEFSKAALLGDYAHYHAESSLAANVFDIRRPDPREHFLILLLLSYLSFESAGGESNGFILGEQLFSELMGRGFTADQVQDALNVALGRRLIETPTRALAGFSAEDQEELSGGFRVRLTSRGAYHCQRWVPTFAYMDAMVFDTPLVDEQLRVSLQADIESFDIRDRLLRTKSFKSYLHAQWLRANLQTNYFDFVQLLQRGDAGFQSVERFIQGRR